MRHKVLLFSLAAFVISAAQLAALSDAHDHTAIVTATTLLLDRYPPGQPDAVGAIFAIDGHVVVGDARRPLFYVEIERVLARTLLTRASKQISVLRLLVRLDPLRDAEFSRLLRSRKPLIVVGWWGVGERE